MDAAKAIRILATHNPPLEPYYVDSGGVEPMTSNLLPITGLRLMLQRRITQSRRGLRYRR